MTSDNIQYRAYDTTPCAIEATSAESIQIENCRLKHIGNDGIGFINDVSNSQCIGNLCVDIGGSAFQVGHPQHLYEGDGGPNEKYSPEVEGICRNIILKNNVLFDLTKLFYGHAGITAYFVDGLKIDHNHIQGTQYSAVSLGWGWNDFELNDWKRKHDNHYSNIYSTSSSQHTGAPDCTITDLHVIPDANWPQEALDIIKNAGPEPQYDAMLKKLPGVVFEPRYRYTVKPLTH